MSTVNAILTVLLTLLLGMALIAGTVALASMTLRTWVKAIIPTIQEIRAARRGSEEQAR